MDVMKTVLGVKKADKELEESSNYLRKYNGGILPPLMCLLLLGVIIAQLIQGKMKVDTATVTALIVAFIVTGTMLKNSVGYSSRLDTAEASKDQNHREELKAKDLKREDDLMALGRRNVEQVHQLNAAHVQETKSYQDAIVRVHNLFVAVTSKLNLGRCYDNLGGEPKEIHELNNAILAARQAAHIPAVQYPLANSEIFTR
jgi:hypothetical protein